MRSDSGVSLTSLRVDGGMAASDQLLQIQADLVGINVERPSNLETTALGAAAAGGLAVGVWESPEDFCNSTAASFTSFSPKADKDDVNARFSQWNKAVERSFGWVDVKAE